MRKIYLLFISFGLIPVLDGQVLTIPVVFHVVWRTSAENIPDSMLNTQLKVLNECFRSKNTDLGSAAPWGAVTADCEIEFCLAQQDTQGNPTSGITRMQTTTVSFSTNDAVKSTANGGEDIWNRDKYLNIWFCNLIGGVDFFSTKPGANANVDGVVISYEDIRGTNAKGYWEKKIGVTAVAEWLNLYTLEACSGCTDCDSVADTPNMAAGCLLKPCTYNDVCISSPPGPMCSNFSTSAPDSCRTFFTMGQKARMRNTLLGTRASLLTSQTCLPVGVQENNFNNAIGIFPNPTSGIFTIKTAKEKIQSIKVYNVLGEKVYDFSFSKNFMMPLTSTVDLSSYPNGIYFVRINTNEGIISKKMVVVK